MKRFLSLSLCLAVIATAGLAFAASNAADRDIRDLHVAVDGQGVVLTSATSNAAVRFKAVGLQDTFPIFGGPATVLDADPGDGPWPNTRPANEGKFQDVNGVIPSFQGWSTHDLTDNPVFFQVSTFNSPTGTAAAWCGQSAAQQPGWAGGAGYGNGWNDILLFRKPVTNTAAGQVVGLDFVFNHDTEPGYDFMFVEYDSAGTWTNLMTRDGSNKDTGGAFTTPVQFSTVATGTATYVGGDYTGGEIGLRVRVNSDGAWSDEDGLWPTSGAVQLDNVTVTATDGTYTENFNSGSFTAGSWNPDKSPFVGDFADVFASVSDIDPCRDNNSPVIGFIDYNQIVRNGPGVNGATQTGGATSSTWSYGIPTGNVVTFTGGLTFGDLAISNEIWSPEITWNIASLTDDDAFEVSGAYIRFSIWRHLPLANGMFYVWHVRSKTAAGNYTGFVDRNFVYYGDDRAWLNFAQNVTDLLVANPDKVQMAFGVADLADVFGFPGADATISPVFDNLAFVKYRIAGPAFASREIDLANDGFPVSGSIDASTEVARDGLDIPFDMARDIRGGTGTANAPGDSIIVDVSAVIPGSSVTDVRMVWALDRNPLFDSVREAPSSVTPRLGTWGGVKDQNVDTTSDPNRWFGEVQGDTSKTSGGAVVAKRFFFDLPDVDLIYPGDELRYYIRATDSGGRVTTFPGDIRGFTTGYDAGANVSYSNAFTIHGLPSISNASGAQPSKLVWNDFVGRGGDGIFFAAMAQLGFVQGVDFDVYDTSGPSSGVSNGLGSAGAHGANADQLAGYNTIVYLAGDLRSYLMSDGSNTGLNDKGNDLGVLTAWHALPGARNAAYFGDFIAFAPSSNSPGAGGTYVSTVMGVSLIDNSVLNSIGFQTAPVVKPVVGAPAPFTSSFVVYGGCLAINDFDEIVPATGAIKSHEWLGPGGVAGAYAPAAGVIYNRLSGVDRKVDITFPFGHHFVQSKNANKTSVGQGTLAKLLKEIFGYMSVTAENPGGITDSPAAKRAELSVFPNPFNPKTTIKFAVPAKADASVKVYNLRGELVRTLHTGELDANVHVFEWNGVDSRGASVASGVYIIKAQAGSEVLTQKAMLVK